MKMFMVVCVLGVLAGAGIALAANSIWSNVVSVTVTNPPPPPFSGVVTLTTNSTTYDTSQTVLLIATLHDPTPTTQQSVTFYFSRMPGANANTPVGTDPLSSFILLKGTTALSSVTTINGVAQITCSVEATGTYYFRAVVANPI